MSKLKYLIIGLLSILSMATSCIEDGITTSPSAQPVFSTDTLKMGLVFTGDVTTTHRFTVQNRNGKGINISDIHLTGEHASLFRLNVDGLSGTRFSNVEIRENDSIYVLVEATLPQNNIDLPVDVNANIEFTVNGVTSKVAVNAQGQDVERLRAHTIEGDMVASATKPYQVFDSLVVAKDATLTLPAGARLYFHDGARLIVRGKLISQGTADKPVTLCGDRTGNVITDITFDLMSRQWGGINFTPSSTGNKLEYTNIRNTVYGIIVVGDGGDELNAEFINCKLRNSGDMVLEAYDANIKAIGCELAEASNGIVYLDGGNQLFNQCTFANYYLFSAIGAPAVNFASLEENVPVAQFQNCIIYGLGTDLSHGDLTGTQIFLRNCLLKSNGSNDDNFIDCIWGEDPLYYTVREDYVFDYRLKPDSPAIGAGNPALVMPQGMIDIYGKNRGSRPDIGAYVFVAPDK